MCRSIGQPQIKASFSPRPCRLTRGPCTGPPSLENVCRCATGIANASMLLKNAMPRAPVDTTAVSLCTWSFVRQSRECFWVTCILLPLCFRTGGMIGGAPSASMRDYRFAMPWLRDVGVVSEHWRDKPFCLLALSVHQVTDRSLPAAPMAIDVRVVLE
ncbi:hypothetical protein HDK90DRAFT_215173 [Phyllosticta capitalensis]|uniref:Uncharacterized protein n=1 Tax=Phyllosticta capitalensis TaxID=121624 RepID=A0ABR1YT44_9PEZI